MGRSSWGKAGAAQAPGTPGDHELAKGKRGRSERHIQDRALRRAPEALPWGPCHPTYTGPSFSCSLTQQYSSA